MKCEDKNCELDGEYYHKGMDITLCELHASIFEYKNFHRVDTLVLRE